MEITLKIPNELARQLASEGKDAARVAVEALALEGIAQSGFRSPQFARCLASKAGYRYMPFSRSMGFTFTTTFLTWIAIE